MSTSILTTGQDALVSAGLAVLNGAGYSFSPLSSAVNGYLATALTGLSGSSASHLTKSRAQLLADLVNTAGAVTVSHLTKTELELWALLADSTFNAGSPDANQLLADTGQPILADTGQPILVQ